MPDVMLSARLVDHFEAGLDAPICLTWELTYACNLACIHCLSSSGRADPRELTTAECFAVIDELQAMQVFYVNIGGGEPTVRRDFWRDPRVRHRPRRRRQVLDQRIAHYARGARHASPQTTTSTSRSRSTARRPAVNDAVRGVGLVRDRDPCDGAPGRQPACAASRSRSSSPAQNVDQLDEFEALADHYGAQLRA